MALHDAVGWMASLVLILTVLQQVRKQWLERSTAGVSRWLFIGQVTASTLFLVYSWQLGNPVFIVSNAVLILTSIVGQILFLRNRAGR